MFFKKDNFSSSGIKDIKVKKKNDLSFIKHYFRWIFSFIIVFFVFIFWSNISIVVWNYVKKLTWIVVQNVSSIAGKEAKKDDLWNINILLLWVWWKNHDGGYLTDTMMIASFNPKLWTLTFLSIPRDLYVKYNKYSGWRINYIFAQEYLKTRSFEKAATKLEDKVKDITWIKPNYYVLVDFPWFIKLVNKLWWVTVDVKQDLIDYRYPWPNRTYTTFKISKWIHHLDGETALKYARSRHSTSDFSRSARQEQIIKALLHKFVSSDLLLSPRKMKWVYMQFKETIHTNFDIDTLLWFVKYAKNIKIHSYVLNADCYYKTTYWKNLTPWCFVFPAKRDDFNWQAVLLPVWSNSLHVDNYDEIKKFVFIALWYPELWLENGKIQLLNGIWNKNIKKFYKWYLKPVASNFAFKLKNYWFNIVDVRNSVKKFDKNTLYMYNKKSITNTLLKNFVWDIEYKTWDVKYSWSGFDMTLILWKDFLYNK